MVFRPLNCHSTRIIRMLGMDEYFNRGLTVKGSKEDRGVDNILICYDDNKVTWLQCYRFYESEIVCYMIQIEVKFY